MIHDMSDLLDKLVKRVRNDTIDEVIAKVKPSSEKPCDCITLVNYGQDKFYSAECNCLNSGDLGVAFMWCESANMILAIKSMKEE